MLHLYLSAGPLDFTPRPVGTSDDAVLFFNNLNRRQCFDVQITPDDLFEEDEMFLLDSIPYTAGSTSLELIPQTADVKILNASSKSSNIITLSLLIKHSELRRLVRGAACAWGQRGDKTLAFLRDTVQKTFTKNCASSPTTNERY